MPLYPCEMPPLGRDESFMRAGLREARKGLGHASPNPAVGAVLVKGGKIVARGHHRQAGRPHAELECLARFKKGVPRGSTLFVTLEPCSTRGRTGPCTEAIIRSGIKSIVIGAIDPNPRHQGRGLELLRRAGIEVRSGLLADECATLNEAFNKWIVTGRPFVIAKCGMSLDGRLTRRLREPHWITDAAARRDAHQLRATVDAILIGAETLRQDNPRLTVRGVRGAKQPWRIVLTRSGKLPRDARLFRDRRAERTLVYKNKSLEAILDDLGKKNVTSVLIEGGGDVLGEALDGRLIDKVQIYLGPILTGGPVVAFGGNGANATANAAKLERVSFAQIGQCVRVTGYFRKIGE
jgi:diaminohydroxyphosphoribosylaminopyrimidine deaminase/5-amino-6-(5-phosphoribosylamino)uracil reductase